MFVLVDFWTRESRTLQHVHGLFWSLKADTEPQQCARVSAGRLQSNCCPVCTLWSVLGACSTPYGPSWCGTVTCFREAVFAVLMELGFIRTNVIINNCLMTTVSPDVQIKHSHRKVPLNVGASLDKVEECRNFNLRGLLGSLAAVCAVLSAFISQIYGPKLAKELLHLLLVW